MTLCPARLRRVTQTWTEATQVIPALSVYKLRVRRCGSTSIQQLRTDRSLRTAVFTWPYSASASRCVCSLNVADSSPDLCRLARVDFVVPVVPKKWETFHFQTAKRRGTRSAKNCLKIDGRVVGRFCAIFVFAFSSLYKGLDVYGVVHGLSCLVLHTTIDAETCRVLGVHTQSIFPPCLTVQKEAVVSVCIIRTLAFYLRCWESSAFHCAPVNIFILYYKSVGLYVNVPPLTCIAYFKLLLFSTSA